jgi:hypothetical protein
VVGRATLDLDDLLAAGLPEHVEGQARLVGHEREWLGQSHDPQPDQQRRCKQAGQVALIHAAKTLT